MAIPAVAAGALLAGATIAPAQNDPIKVGVVLPITGILAAYGTPYEEALKIAVEEVNSAGGIDGRMIELVVEDSQASNTVAINALNKVMQSDPVAVFGPGLGTQLLALMPVTEKAKMPLFGSAGTRRVTQTGAEYFFRNTAHDGVTNEMRTRYIVDTLGLKNVAVLHVANEWGYSGRDNTEMYLKDLYGLAPVFVGSYQPTDKDMTVLVKQAADAGADVFVIQGHPVDEALIVRQVRQLGLETPVVASGSLCFAYLKELVTSEELAGDYCVTVDVLPNFNERPAVQAYAEKYKERTGYYPDIYSTNYYDGMGMLFAVIKEVGLDREKIRDGFRTMTYEGILGPYKSDEEGNLWHNATVMKFSAGDKVEVAKRLHE